VGMHVCVWACMCVCMYITILATQINWQLHGLFFDAIIDIASYVGWQGVSMLRPLLDQVSTVIFSYRAIQSAIDNISLSRSNYRVALRYVHLCTMFASP